MLPDAGSGESDVSRLRSVFRLINQARGGNPLGEFGKRDVFGGVAPLLGGRIAEAFQRGVGRDGFCFEILEIEFHDACAQLVVA